ncbi:MAG: (Fe-S)-binding protein [Candidatus Marinimicrobia bacterium]|jgi:Fe-S oxidoreductase|nr:(Fe-S)-binding protein [Candidatus Neomarinimicrobiota bacterium]|tara:strand:- start:4342 stop:5658 length:1317 start_codon:yes stop_codon:yes gene_type:complete
MAHKKEISEALKILDSKLSLPLVTYLETCTHCAVCADSCHLFHIDEDPIHMPCFKADKLRRVYKRHYTFSGKYLPWLVGARDLTDEELDGWVDSVYQCTMCRRCSIACPIGIDNALVVRTSRSILSAMGKAPEMLEEHTDNACKVGSPLKVTKEEFLDRLEWFEEELQDELDDDDYEIPIDKEGAEFLFIPASLEMMKFPQTIISTLKIFYASDVNYTFSSVRYDVTNYGVFNGDDAATKSIAMKDIEEAERLGIRTLVVSECGHAYRALRWEAPNWLRKEYTFKVKDIVELVHEWIRDGRLKVDPMLNPEKVTYHDPCNMGRNAGLFEEPRDALTAAVSDFIDMIPNRENNWCCGGGGGMLSMPEYDDNRLASGVKKAEQVRETGASVLVTACANCQMQLGQVMEHFDVEAKVESVTDVVANALVMEKEAIEAEAVM